HSYVDATPLPKREYRSVHVARAHAQLREIAALREVEQEEGLGAHLVALLAPLERRFACENNVRASEAVLRILVQIAPASTGFRIVLGETLAELGDVDGAIEELRVSAEQLMAEDANDEALAVLERLLALRADAKHARLPA